MMFVRVYPRETQEMRRFRRVDSPYPEEVCAENNDAMLGFDYHIPKSEKPDF